MKIILFFLINLLLIYKSTHSKKRTIEKNLSKLLNIKNKKKTDRKLLNANKKKAISSFFNSIINHNEKRNNDNRNKVFARNLVSGGDPEFPPLPPGDQMPIKINSPPVNLPKFSKPYELNSKLVFVPTIIYPKKKKRIMIHHAMNPMGYYKNLYSSMNPYYYQMGKNNPNLKNSWEDKKLQHHVNNHGIKEQMDLIKKYVPKPDFKLEIPNLFII